jgi:hypothetical protein
MRDMDARDAQQKRVVVLVGCSKDEASCRSARDTGSGPGGNQNCLLWLASDRSDRTPVRFSPAR